MSEFESISLGVATPDEALELLALGYSGRIILLGYTHPKCYYQIVHSGCQLAAYRPENIPPLVEACRSLARPLELHIKVDTGMTRLGVSVEALPAFIRELRKHPQIAIVGLFSHMAHSGQRDAPINERQEQLFMRAIEIATAELGYRPECHLANSGALLNYPGLHLDSVRTGILPFGVYPPGQYEQLLPVEPCFRLSSEVIDLHRLKAGEGVSYCQTWTAAQETTVATLPYGYADGNQRAASNKGSVLINGQRCRQVGNITMDYVMVDCGDMDVRIGDRAVFIGTDGAEQIGINEVAEQAGTVAYDISCAWSRRVRRVYSE
jgi:alanine racemase